MSITYELLKAIQIKRLLQSVHYGHPVLHHMHIHTAVTYSRICRVDSEQIGCHRYSNSFVIKTHGRMVLPR